MTDMKEDKLLGEWEDDETEMESFDVKVARKMIRKTRLRMILWALSTVLGVLFLYGVYMMFVNIAFDNLNYQRKFERYVTTVVESHHPGLWVELAGAGTRTEISPLFTQTTTMKLYRGVGNWQVSAGEVRASKTLFGSLTYELDLDTRYLNQGNQFQFAVPLDLIGSTYKPMEKPQDHVWNLLEKIGDGYVAEMAVSTVKGMSARELVQLFEKYDLRVSEMAVFAGELKEIKQLTYSGSDGDYFVNPLMMRPYREYSAEHFLMSSAGSFDTMGEGVEHSEELFLLDLQWMLDNRGSYYGDHTDEQRLAYLQREGIKVYGAIVTGPVRELEKLRANENLRYFQLGQVEFWNWHME